MAWIKNTTGILNGSYRSLNGAADESIFQGKASKAGFYCFFKVWRDMPYDAVLDYEGVLYRVEVKGSSGNSFDFSRGGRSGAQINRAAVSRKRPIEREDCDFVVGVNSDNGDCYIVPTDVVEILGVMSLSKTSLDVYKEKWNLFKCNGSRMDSKSTRDGLRSRTLAEIQRIYSGFTLPTVPTQITITGMRNKAITDQKDIMILTIWEYLACL